MSEEPKKNKIKVTSRAVIMNGDKMLLVKLPHDTSYYCLPGGHLEFGEGVKECLSREITEELGVAPEIGRLLYINTYLEKENIETIEFFFEVTNGINYLKTEDSGRTHANEIAEIYWAKPEDNVRILPAKLNEDFKNGTIISDNVKFVNGLV